MKYLSLFFIIFIIGCSNKPLNSLDTQYQNFLNHRSDKKLDKELKNYEKK